MYLNKNQENKSQSIAKSVSRKKKSAMPSFQFTDNRPNAITQLKLQEMANNSPQVKQAAQLQSIANNYPIHLQLLNLKKENNSGLPDKLNTNIAEGTLAIPPVNDPKRMIYSV